MSIARANPWYREPWPWIIMAAPATAVVAGVITFAIAVNSFDGLVAEDYYKQGLAVNKQLARVHKAKELGLQGEIEIESHAGGAVRVDLRGQSAAKDDLVLTLSHPTRAGLDQRVTLQPAGNDVYVGRIGALPAGRWHVSVESASGQWRIRGELQAPQRKKGELSWQP
jgi:hypothetical protein